MATVLEEELQTYEARKAELVREAEGRFVLIKGSEVVDHFADQFDAIREGYRRFGNVPFLVKQIVEVEIPLSFTRDLGL